MAQLHAKVRGEINVSFSSRSFLNSLMRCGLETWEGIGVHAGQDERLAVKLNYLQTR
ncbi:hypothetical protein [Novosphingobium resinovorum]|uniref:hypothetical protein n=1 Tax=Novosphingobium resinovorum TaxID=158500 RepID=UPI002ED1EA99